MLHALLSGALLGLLSIPHCTAMCGPLSAFACSRSTRSLSPLRYQLGRTLGYTTGGAVCGHVGRVLRWIQPGATAVVFFSALAACACLVVAHTLVRKRAEQPLVQLSARPRKRAISTLIAGILPNDPTALGALTVLLPCGVLAAALLVAVTTSQAVLGAAVMLGFVSTSGVALLAAGALARFVPPRASEQVRRGLALMLVATAVVLIARPVGVLVFAAYTGVPAVMHCH